MCKVDRNSAERKRRIFSNIDLFLFHYRISQVTRAFKFNEQMQYFIIFILSQSNSTSTQIESDKVIRWPVSGPNSFARIMANRKRKK